MNRFFTLLLAASCLTAVGQEDCLNVLACNYGELEPCSFPEIGKDCFGNCASGGSPSFGNLYVYDDGAPELVWQIWFNSFSDDLWSYVVSSVPENISEGMFESGGWGAEWYDFYIPPGLQVRLNGSVLNSPHSILWQGNDDAWNLRIEFLTFDFPSYSLCEGDEVTIELVFTGGDCEASFNTTQTVSVPSEYQGCSDYMALNYNPNAICYQDDWLYCLYPEGCMDPSACNFDPDALVDYGGECEYFSCIGCTDPNACNYSTSATIDDDSCLPFDAIGVCGGNCQEDEDNNGTCDDQEVYGCGYQLAENYNPEVTRDDGSCIFPCEGVVNTNVFDWDGDYVVTVTDFLMMLSVYGDTDVDLDGVWDSGDDCVDTDACNYASDPSEPCAYIDVLGVCGGGCDADEDDDGICDDEDSCIGVIDECGVCNGPGPTQVVIEDIVITFDSVFLPFDNEWFVFPVAADTAFAFVCEIEGCTDPSAENYNDSADVDDGTCIYPWPCGLPFSFQNHQYETVQIGEQCWFAENLRSEFYNNGDAIPTGLSDADWQEVQHGAMTIYGDDEGCSEWSPDINACNVYESLNEYGRLYNWYSVVDERGLCPSGWHVPSDEEWIDLEIAIGMSQEDAFEFGPRGSNQGTQMKVHGYGWYNYGYGSNSSGFSALPAGIRDASGYFFYAGKYPYWWSITEDGQNAISRSLHFNYQPVYRYQSNKNSGFSIRCIQDAD